MSETAPRAKRKRSAIACVACHDRKVRCNAAHQGIPCSNCLEDGVKCEVYRRSPQIPKRRLSVLEGQPPQPPSPIYPYSGVANGQFNGSQPSPVATTSDRESYTERTPASYGNDYVVPPKPAKETGPDAIGYSRAPRSSSADRSRVDVRPFYSGESQGLEFLFDLVSPDRTTRGLHYATPAATYRAKRTEGRPERLQPHFPPSIVQQELIRCFFHYVWPVAPIVNAKDFLLAWSRGDRQVSPLLLWSVFFAAASYVDSEALKAHHLPTRKALKEEFYQNAKNIHDAREEPEKTVLMQSAFLLATWYIDLEDRDGITYWSGIAISLAHTIGIHRKDDYDTVHPPPFSVAERRIWRCLWWCIYYRDVWAAMGFGRPMKIDSEDCDAPMLTVEDILGPCVQAEMPLDLQGYMPPNLRELANLMVNFLELSAILERILKSYYRPKSGAVTAEKIERDEREILACRNRMLIPQFDDAPVLAVHSLHIRAYYTAALIAIYRPYLAERIGRTHSADVQSVGSQAEKAATEMTNVLNEVISKNITELVPSMFIICTMTSMQIFFWKVCHSTGLARQYAHNQLDLYMLALSHFRKTYWTADLQYNMFIEALKSMDSRSTTISRPVTETPSRQNEYRSASAQATDMSGDAQSDGSHLPGSLEDFLISFNPFMGVPMQGDNFGSPIDWGLSPASPLRFGESPQTMNPINP